MYVQWDTWMTSSYTQTHWRTIRTRYRRFCNTTKKCKFHMDTVEYLGFILSPNGLQMDPSKVSTITEWPEPQKVKDIQAFLGFANFYQRFIHEYAEMTLPLTNLCKKNHPWHFGKEELEAFNWLKDAFTAALILANWSPDLLMMVETDASDRAIAGIISVTTPDNEIRPVAFHSRSLHSAERNYDTHDKELLAIFVAFKRWHSYLEGVNHPVDTVMDHKNLEYFTTTKKLTQRQARWSKFLSPFNFKIRFRPKQLGAKPDALTHRSDIYKGKNVEGNLRPIFSKQQVDNPELPVWVGALEEMDSGVKELLDFDKLVKNINKATKLDPLANSILHKLDSANILKGWELMNGVL